MVHSVYETEELLLILSNKKIVTMVTDYYIRNKDFLMQFEPSRSEVFYTQEHQEMLLEDDCKQIDENSGYRFWIVEKDNPNIIIGTIALTAIVMGAFKSCFMGYKLDKDYLNSGYMTQAVTKCVEIAFNDVGLHRIEANIMPRNKASLRVVEKAGFQNEGLSKEYLMINGVWEDHIHMVILNH